VGDLVERMRGSELNSADPRVLAFRLPLDVKAFGMVSPDDGSELTLYFPDLDREMFNGFGEVVDSVKARLGIAASWGWLPEFGSGEIQLCPASRAEVSAEGS